jgi:chorismate synthase
MEGLSIVLEYITAGESHGRAVIALVSGFPAGYEVDIELINRDLALRQGGHGRSARQKIEKDQVEFLSGLRKGRTLGSPIAMVVFNKDVRIDDISEESVPRPGHAELAGALKYGTYNVREISERASARETAARVMAGSLAKQFLSELGVDVLGVVRNIGSSAWKDNLNELKEIRKLRNSSAVYCPDKESSGKMVREIDEAKERGDTLGGVVEVVARGVIPGLGSCMNRNERLDGKLANALMSIPSVKGVEIGAGFEAAGTTGKKTADVVKIEKGDIKRSSNFAGGLEGGMTNGADILVRAAFKPIPTTKPPAKSVDLTTGKEVMREWERSDVCAVPAGAIIAEAVVSFEILQVYCDKFGGDTVSELRDNLARFLEKIQTFWKKVRKVSLLVLICV